MAIVDTHTPAAKEHKQVVNDKIMSNVLNLQRFLKKLNYGEQFCE